MGAQAELGLRCLHTQEDTFCPVRPTRAMQKIGIIMCHRITTAQICLHSLQSKQGICSSLKCFAVPSYFEVQISLREHAGSHFPTITFCMSRFNCVSKVLFYMIRPNSCYSNKLLQVLVFAQTYFFFLSCR